MEKEKENQELKKRLAESSIINVADHKYASECEDKVITMESQQKEFIEYLKDSLCLMDIISEAEDESDRHYALIRRTTYKEILSKYKEIIGVKNE